MAKKLEKAQMGKIVKSAGKTISKKWPARWLFDLHRSRNFNLVEEINNLNLLPNKLSKWKK